MRQEPIRHHFIPQFILKNFCFEEKHLHYYDKQTGTFSVVDTRDAFMERNLYRDEINHEEDPAKIEKDLAVFEREVSEILKTRFLTDHEFFITNEENEKLKLFFAIMSFRSVNAKNTFGKKPTEQTTDFYRAYQPDGNILDLWKRNLGLIVRCRSFDELQNHPDIDPPIKIFLHRDTVGVTGKYLAVAEAPEGTELIIGDTYPVMITGDFPAASPLEIHRYFPISPKRVLFFVSNGAVATPREVLKLRPHLLRPPLPIPESNTLRFRVRKLCESEVYYLNTQVAGTAKQGFTFLSAPPK